MITNIFIFGDSIVDGNWDREKGGWTERLKLFFNEKRVSGEGVFVYSLGIAGNTSKDLLDRVEFESYQRQDEQEKNIFIFAIGMNDSVFLPDKNRNLISPDQFKENLQYLTALARKYSKSIIFVGLNRIEESKTTPLFWHSKMYCYDKHLKQYNEIIKAVCKEHKLIFVDILEEFKKEKYKELLDKDGLHPNAQGHQKIFEIVKKALEKNKII